MVQNQITALFTHASNIYNLNNNPCKKVKKMGKSDADKLNFWTKDEYDCFISGIDRESKYYVIFEILFWTGCREGEMLALTKEDVDFQNNQISITKTYYRTERRDIITTLKTEQSVRVIDIPQFLTKEIEMYVNRCYGLPDNERLFPIVAEAYLGADVDMHRANEIRPVLKQLGNIAEEYGCAIVLIGHMNKASGSKSTYRGLGSIDFQATARSALVVGRIKDDTALRVIAHDKSSLAPEGMSIAFRMDKDNGFTWEGVYDITVEELLSGESRGQKTKDAKSFLAEILAEGQLSCNEITEAAKERGIKKKTLWNAKKEMNIDCMKNKTI